MASRGKMLGLADRLGPVGPSLARAPGPFNPIRPGPAGPNPLMFPGGPAPLQQVSLPAVMEHKLASAQTEMQRLLTENQRLAATLMALRQEVAASQSEVQRMQQAMTAQLAEKDANMRSAIDQNMRMVEELRKAEPLKQELHATRMELKNTQIRCQEAEQARLAAHQQLQAVTTEFHKARQELSQMPAMRQELQQVPALHQEIQGLRQELQQARAHLDYEKKLNADQLENRQRMEKNLVAMARENENIRAELTNTQKALGRAQPGGNPPWTAVGAATQGDWGSDMWQSGTTPPPSSVPSSIPGWSSFAASVRRPV